MRRPSCPAAIVMGGFVLSTAVVRSNPVLAQSRTYKSGVELVPLTVTVTDRAGRHVPDLTSADFAVFEGGKRQVRRHRLVKQDVRSYPGNGATIAGSELANT